MPPLQHFLHMLQLLFWILSQEALCQNNAPKLIWPDSATQQQKAKLINGLHDARKLAKVAAGMADRCDPAFQRYFRQADFDFVGQIFRTIIDINLNAEIDSNNILEIGLDWHPKFTNMYIALGNNPFRPSWGTLSCEGSNSEQHAFMEIGDNGEAYVSICESLMEYPTLQEIENPPESLRDPIGNYPLGYSCNGLSDHDSDLMDSVGSIILHEFIHWGWLYESVPDYFARIESTPGLVHMIRDFGGQDTTPPNGYGPYHAKMIKDLLEWIVKPVEYHEWETLMNVDNYVYYANSKYWSFTCKKYFGPALSQEDAYLRYSDGFVPKDAILQLPPG